jgi:HSP20 family molecular chaperone IbpA
MKINEIFREMAELHRKMTEDMFKGMGSFKDTFLDFDSLEEKVKVGELEGNWTFEPIERPGMKGFIARGFFSTPGLPERPPMERPTDILPPLKPNLKELRIPLYDLSVGGDELILFVELPGVNEQDITLDFEGKRLKLEAGNFGTQIDLSSWVIQPEEMTTEYRNGVLKIVIPKTGLDEQLI